LKGKRTDVRQTEDKKGTGAFGLGSTDQGTREELIAMATTVINGKELVVDDEGFMTQYDEWDENIGQELATAIGVDMTDDHWKVIRFLR
jgi:Dissimilatory sulfite reductase (desulfoviridin), gamma subunit